MVNPIPKNVKAILNELSGPQQVALRTYIASLRGELKEHESAQLAAAAGDDPHAHYHGDKKCTADHSHGDSSHGEESATADTTEHHHHHETCTADHSHEHKHEENKEAHGDGHDHGHDIEEPEDVHMHEDHKHEHHGHSHNEHSEKEKEVDDVPAWKRRALETGNIDPMAAPFGGNWTAEASLSATGDKDGK